MFAKSLFLLSTILYFNVISQNPLFPKYNSASSSWNYLDRSGKIVLTVQNIEKASIFNDKVAAVLDKKTKLWGYINEKGNYIIKPQFESAGYFLDGLAIVRKKCTSGCNKGQEGLLSQYNGYIIDKAGKIISQDNAQDEQPYKRFFLHENLGKGFFSIERGIGLGERKDFVNFKMEFLGETVTSYGNGGIFYDYEIEAVKCGLKYFDKKGQIKLDLSRYQLITEEFSEGFVWSDVSYEDENGEYISIKVLVDSIGVALVNMDINIYNQFTPVKNGIATCRSIETGQTYTYDVSTKLFALSKNQLSIEVSEDYFIEGHTLSNGNKFIYSEDYQEIIGLKLSSGEKLFLSKE